MANLRLHTIITPFDPDASYLIWKLDGVDNIGETVSLCMPLRGLNLCQSTIDVIREWIANGAID